MICAQCNLNFNMKRKRITFKCLSSYCKNCLAQNSQNKYKCPIKQHINCSQIQSLQDVSYLTKKSDKDIKITILGDKRVGKTTLIKSMINKVSEYAQKSTLSIDIFKIERQYKDLILSFFIWDTPMTSSIFLQHIEQNIDLTAKSSNIQIIVFSQNSTISKLDKFINEILQKVKHPAIIIIYNSRNGINEDLLRQIQQLYKNSINCKELSQVQGLWRSIQDNSLSLKVLSSKLKGKIVNLAQSRKIAIQKPKCNC